MTDAERKELEEIIKAEIEKLNKKLDGMLANNIALSDHFTALGIEHQFIQVPDVGHTAPLLMQAVKDESIEFYNSLFKR